MMIEIREEDEYNDTYERQMMRATLLLKKEKKHKEIDKPKERTVCRIMEKLGILHCPRKPKGLTKSDKKAMTSDDLLKRNFKVDRPNEKCVTNITELKGSDQESISPSYSIA